MRVSNKQMINIVKADLFRNSAYLMKAEERVATRKMINRPSDDPIGMGKILDYRKTISSIDQYNRNIVSAKNQTEFTGTLLENLQDLLTQAKRIVSEHSANALDPALRESAVQELKGIHDQTLAIANTKYNGNYLFAGHKTDTLPFPTNEVAVEPGSSVNDGESFLISSASVDYYVWYNVDGGLSDPNIAGRTGIQVDISSADSAAQVASATQTAIAGAPGPVFNAALNGSSVTITTSADSKGVHATDHDSGFSFYNADYNGDNGKLNTIVGEGIQVRLNLTGNEVFSSGVNSVFQHLKTLKEALAADPFDPSVLSGLENSLAENIDQVETAAVKLSTTYKRLESSETHWNQFRNSVLGMLSRVEDADLATAIVELQAQETAYEASLASAKKLLGKRSLVDFLG